MSVSTNEEITEDPSPIQPCAVISARRSSYLSENATGISPIISESPDSITIRQPIRFHSAHPAIGSSRQQHTVQEQAVISRYQYYSRLSALNGNPERELVMPNHVVPSSFFLVIPLKTESKQNSVITIFSIWNTMMGTSVLSMPWALTQAGFGCGLAFMLLMAAMCFYTAYRIMNSIKTIDSINTGLIDFPDVCRYWLGRGGEYVAIIFSVATLLGAAIVYWVLMTNFLFSSVKFGYEKINGELNTTASSFNISHDDAVCMHPLKAPSANVALTSTWHTKDAYSEYATEYWNLLSENHSRDALFAKIWNPTLTVPFFLVLIIGPLINFKSATIFTKFNALGTFSVMYILIFIGVKAYNWGINADFKNHHELHSVNEFEWTFPALTGTLSLALFIHNCVISIMRTQKNLENNGRDLSIAYVCVSLTYIYIGAIFYLTFPLPKYCIADNLLNNFKGADVMAFIARIFLLFQMVTVFPLLMYILRVQCLTVLFNNVYPSLKHVLGVNSVILGICITFAICLPKIGTIIRFSGALCGVAYIFTLPCLVHMRILHHRGALTKPMIAIHSVLILIGVLNFIGQFIII